MYNHKEFIKSLSRDELLAVANGHSEVPGSAQIVDLGQTCVLHIRWEIDEYAGLDDQHDDNPEIREAFVIGLWDWMGCIADIYIEGKIITSASLWGIESFVLHTGSSYGMTDENKRDFVRLIEGDVINDALARLPYAIEDEAAYLENRLAKIKTVNVSALKSPAK